MPFDFDCAVNDNGRSSHDVIFHHLGYILDFGEFDIEIIFFDYIFYYRVSLFALGAAGSEDKNFAHFCILIDDNVAGAAAGAFRFGSEKG